jgi:hypothetical protein
MATATAEKSKGAKPKGKPKASFPVRAKKQAAPAESTKALTPSGKRMAIEALGAGAVELAAEVEGLLRTMEQTALATWWQIGKRFVSIREHWEDVGVKTICKQLDLDDREVRMAMRAATMWSERDVLAIVEEARQKGGKVTWSHTRLLLALDDTRREKYLEVIKNKRMGYKALYGMIKAEGRGRGKKGGGRQFNIPATFDGLYVAGIQQTASFHRFFDQMGKKLPGALDRIDENRFSPDLLNRVRKIREECDRVAQTAHARGEELTEFERRIEQRLGLQEDVVPSSTNGAAAEPVALAPPTARKVIVRRPPGAAKTKKEG